MSKHRQDKQLNCKSRMADLVLRMSITCNNIVFYLSISIHLLCQSIRSSTSRLLLAKTHWELCNMNLWICSSISKILTAERTMWTVHVRAWRIKVQINFYKTTLNLWNKSYGTYSLNCSEHLLVKCEESSLYDGHMELLNKPWQRPAWRHTHTIPYMYWLTDHRHNYHSILSHSIWILTPHRVTVTVFNRICDKRTWT